MDHGGVCKPYMAVFLECMAQHQGVHDSCRESSKRYLQCRMDGDLMAQEDLNTLGFAPDIKVVPAKATEEDGKEIIAGLSAVKKNGVGIMFGLGSSAKRGGGH